MIFVKNTCSPTVVPQHGLVFGRQEKGNEKKKKERRVDRKKKRKKERKRGKKKINAKE